MALPRSRDDIEAPSRQSISEILSAPDSPYSSGSITIGELARALNVPLKDVGSSGYAPVDELLSGSGVSSANVRAPLSLYDYSARRESENAFGGWLKGVGAGLLVAPLAALGKPLSAISSTANFAVDLARGKNVWDSMNQWQENANLAAGPLMVSFNPESWENYTFGKMLRDQDWLQDRDSLAQITIPGVNWHIDFTPSGLAAAPGDLLLDPVNWISMGFGKTAVLAARASVTGTRGVATKVAKEGLEAAVIQAVGATDDVSRAAVRDLLQGQLDDVAAQIVSKVDTSSSSATRASIAKLLGEGEKTLFKTFADKPVRVALKDDVVAEMIDVLVAGARKGRSGFTNGDANRLARTMQRLGLNEYFEDAGEYAARAVANKIDQPFVPFIDEALDLTSSSAMLHNQLGWKLPGTGEHMRPTFNRVMRKLGREELTEPLGFAFFSASTEMQDHYLRLIPQTMRKLFFEVAGAPFRKVTRGAMSGRAAGLKEIIRTSTNALEVQESKTTLRSLARGAALRRRAEAVLGREAVGWMSEVDQVGLDLGMDQKTIGVLAFDALEGNADAIETLGVDLAKRGTDMMERLRLSAHDMAGLEFVARRESYAPHQVTEEAAAIINKRWSETGGGPRGKFAPQFFEKERKYVSPSEFQTKMRAWAAKEKNVTNWGKADSSVKANLEAEYRSLKSSVTDQFGEQKFLEPGSMVDGEAVGSVAVQIADIMNRLGIDHELFNRNIFEVLPRYTSMLAQRTGEVHTEQLLMAGGVFHDKWITQMRVPDARLARASHTVRSKLQRVDKARRQLAETVKRQMNAMESELPLLREEFDNTVKILATAENEYKEALAFANEVMQESVDAQKRLIDAEEAIEAARVKLRVLEDQRSSIEAGARASASEKELARIVGLETERQTLLDEIKKLELGEGQEGYENGVFHGTWMDATAAVAARVFIEDSLVDAFGSLKTAKEFAEWYGKNGLKPSSRGGSVLVSPNAPKAPSDPNAGKVFKYILPDGSEGEISAETGNQFFTDLANKLDSEHIGEWLTIQDIDRFIPTKTNDASPANAILQSLDILEAEGDRAIAALDEMAARYAGEDAVPFEHFPTPTPEALDDARVTITGAFNDPEAPVDQVKFDAAVRLHFALTGKDDIFRVNDVSDIDALTSGYLSRLTAREQELRATVAGSPVAQINFPVGGAISEATSSMGLSQYVYYQRFRREYYRGLNDGSVGRQSRPDIDDLNNGTWETVTDASGAPKGRTEGAKVTYENNSYYVKQYKSETQAHAEAVSNALYRELGVAAPVSWTSKSPDGSLWHISNWEDNLVPLEGVSAEQLANSVIVIDEAGSGMPYLVAAGTGIRDGVKTFSPSAEIGEGFAADVLLGNWDAFGDDMKNLFLTTDGRVIRLNAGETFSFRGDGSVKTFHKFEPTSPQNPDWFPPRPIDDPDGFRAAADYDTVSVQEHDLLSIPRQGSPSAGDRFNRHATVVDIWKGQLEDHGLVFDKRVADQINRLEIVRAKYGGWEAFVRFQLPVDVPEERVASLVNFLEARAKKLYERYGMVYHEDSELAQVAARNLGISESVIERAHKDGRLLHVIRNESNGHGRVSGNITFQPASTSGRVGSSPIAIMQSKEGIKDIQNVAEVIPWVDGSGTNTTLSPIAYYETGDPWDYLRLELGLPQGHSNIKIYGVQPHKRNRAGQIILSVGRDPESQTGYDVWDFMDEVDDLTDTLSSPYGSGESWGSASQGDKWHGGIAEQVIDMLDRSGPDILDELIIFSDTMSGGSGKYLSKGERSARGSRIKDKPQADMSDAHVSSNTAVRDVRTIMRTPKLGKLFPAYTANSQRGLFREVLEFVSWRNNRVLNSFWLRTSGYDADFAGDSLETLIKKYFAATSKELNPEGYADEIFAAESVAAKYANDFMASVHGAYFMEQQVRVGAPFPEAKVSLEDAKSVFNRPDKYDLAVDRPYLAENPEGSLIGRFWERYHLSLAADGYVGTAWMNPTDNWALSPFGNWEKQSAGRVSRQLQELQLGLADDWTGDNFFVNVTVTNPLAARPHVAVDDFVRDLPMSEWSETLAGTADKFYVDWKKFKQDFEERALEVLDNDYARPVAKGKLKRHDGLDPLEAAIARQQAAATDVGEVQRVFLWAMNDLKRAGGALEDARLANQAAEWAKDRYDALTNALVALRNLDPERNFVSGQVGTTAASVDDLRQAVRQLALNDLEDLKHIMREFDNDYDAAMKTLLTNVGDKSNFPKVATQVGKAWEAGMRPVGTRSQGPKAIVDSMIGYESYNTRGGMNGFLRHYDKAQNIWKGYAVLSPGFYMRNFMGGSFMNFLAGVNTSSYARYFKAHRWLRVDEAQAAGTLTKWKALKLKKEIGKVSDFDLEIARQIDRSGLAGGGQASVEFVPESGKRGVVTIAGKRVDLGKLNPFLSRNYLLKAGKEFNVQFVEQGLRGTLLFDAMSKGSRIDDASDLVWKYHFDYDDLSFFERRVVKRVVPFYTWSRNVVPRMFEQYATNPGRMHRYVQGMNALESEFDDDKRSLGVVPDWMVRQGAVPIDAEFGGEKMWVIPDLPVRNVYDLLGPSLRPDMSPMDRASAALTGVGSMVSPLIKAPLEVAFQRNIWKGYSFDGSYEYVPSAYTNIPLLMETLSLVGGDSVAAKTPQGDWVMRDHWLHGMAQLLPPLTNMRRLFPDEEKYQRRTMSTWVSFFLGIGLRTNTQYEQDLVRRQQYYERRDETRDLARLRQIDLGDK